MVNRIPGEHHFTAAGLVAIYRSNFGTLGDRAEATPNCLTGWLLSVRCYPAGRSRRCTGRSCSQRPINRVAALNQGPSDKDRAGNALLVEDGPTPAGCRSSSRREFACSPSRAGSIEPSGADRSALRRAPATSRRTFYAAISRHDLGVGCSASSRLSRSPTSPAAAAPNHRASATALMCFNSDFHDDSCPGRRGAVAKSVSSVEQGDGERIRQAYLLLYGRAARPHEVELAVAYLQTPELGAAGESTAHDSPTRWERYTQALLASNEFLFVD